MSETSPVPQPPSGSSEDVGTSGDASAEGPTTESSPGDLSRRTPAIGQLSAPAVLVERLDREAPSLEAICEPEVKLLVAGWLAGFRSPRTRRAYGGDLAAFQRWCTARGLGVVRAGRVQVDLYITDLLHQPLVPSSVSRRSPRSRRSSTSSPPSVRRAPSPLGRIPRPASGDRASTHRPPPQSGSIESRRALVAAVDRDCGSQRLRSRALIRLLLHSALRVDEVINADRADLARQPGRIDTHVTLTVTRKGGRRAVIALAPPTVGALELYLTTRPTSTRAPNADRSPLLCTRSGGRLTQKAVWLLVRRIARRAGIADWDRLSPHSLRHTSITLALDAGAPLRDVQDFAGHRDARTTRRYDRSRESLDRSPTYAVARWLNDE